MKALLLSTSLAGGAGGATYRLHQGLQDIGINSQVLVQTKDANDEAVIVVPRTKRVKLLKLLGKLPYVGDFQQLPLRLYRNRTSRPFSIEFFPDAIAQRVAQIGPEVINLHWICGGFLRAETVPLFKKPIVWTLHDMWPFTGGCYHSEGCDHYTGSCGLCPILRSNKNWDVSRWVWRRKAKAWKNLNLTVVTPSSWLAECARASSLFKDVRIEVIPNGIDITRFKPIDRKAAREILNLPQDKRIVLFGVWRPNHPWKGLHLLQSAIQSLNKAGWQNKLELIIFGLDRPDIRSDLGVKWHYLGKLSDNISLAIIYSAADVLVHPSVTDNLPTNIIEAFACGIPCVAFNIGGIPDIIDHCKNGYLAQPYEVKDLAQGIAWVLEKNDRQQRLSRYARAKAEKQFALELYAKRYADLFTEIVENHNQ